MSMENIITLEFQDGKILECEMLGVFPYKDKEFAALIPNEGSDDVYLYEFIELQNGFELRDIEDENLFNKAIEEFAEFISND